MPFIQFHICSWEYVTPVNVFLFFIVPAVFAECKGFCNKLSAFSVSEEIYISEPGAEKKLFFVVLSVLRLYIQKK